MVLSRRPLKNIVKITSKKKMPELITFKYGSSGDEGVAVTDGERFIIEKAGECLQTQLFCSPNIIAQAPVAVKQRNTLLWQWGETMASWIAY